MEHLRGAGYDIQALNWRIGRYELDIVATHAGVLHFVEVKTRRADGLLPPEAAMTHHKQQALTIAAKSYLTRTGWQGEVQFDLAAVDMLPDGTAQVRIIEQAIEYNW